jgi:hypothetical protein
MLLIDDEYENQLNNEDFKETRPCYVVDSSTDDIYNDFKMKNSKLTNLDVRGSTNKNKNNRNRRGRSLDSCFRKRISINASFNVEEVLNRLGGEITVKRKLAKSHTLKLKRVTIRNSIKAIYWDTPKPDQTPVLSTKSILKVTFQKSSCDNLDKSTSFIRLLLQLIDFKESLKVFSVSFGSFIISYLFFKKLKL